MDGLLSEPMPERRTTTDEIFDRLRADIVSLRLAPGAKLSEAEVAKSIDVSRQPVREAFIRLSDQNLVQIRPQKATQVRRISVRDITHTRFVRLAVEVEVIRRACERADAKALARIERNLQQQERAVARTDGDGFHDLDYDFHRLLCEAADCAFAFATISGNKSHVDRLCMLSLATQAGIAELYDDHMEIFRCLERRDAEAMVEATRLHLGRLDQTIVEAREHYPDFFED